VARTAVSSGSAVHQNDPGVPLAKGRHGHQPPGGGAADLFCVSAVEEGAAHDRQHPPRRRPRRHGSHLGHRRRLCCVWPAGGMLAPASHPHSRFRSSRPTRRTRPPPAGVVAPGPRARSSPAERSARTILVDRPVDVAPVAGDLPAVPDPMPTRSGCLGQQRREWLGPAVDGDVIDLDAAFGEQLLDVAVRQREAQGPADRQHDHVGREAEAGEGRSADASGAGSGELSWRQSACTGLAHSRCNSPAGAPRASATPTDHAARSWSRADTSTSRLTAQSSRDLRPGPATSMVGGTALSGPSSRARDRARRRGRPAPQRWQVGQ
jgi:hypothetical protein